MSLLYSPSFNYQDGELRRNQELMDLNHHNYHQEQHQHNSGLMRYRSAPSSFIESLVNGTSGHGGNGGGGGIEVEDSQYFRPSSPEMDAMLARFMSTYNGSGDSNSQNLKEYGERPAMKQEMDDSQMVYQSSPVNNLANNGNSVDVSNSLDSTFGVMNSMALEKSMQASKMSTVNGSNLVRQNSSPAGFFYNLGVDNGFTVTEDVGGFRACNGLNGEANPSNSRLSNHLNFPSGQRLLPQIAEIGDENPGTSSPEGNTRKRQYMNFANDTWDDSSSNDFKRFRSNDENVFSGLYMMGNQSENSGNRVTGLTHHLSLPKTAAEMATVEKFLQFQGSIPCKIRAKRGCATHPRSIAERVRRTRISERMRKLQDLFPNMDKQTSTADKLDLAVEYIKELQKQVETLKDTRAKCMCSSKQKQYSNSSA
ncbi:hypothetical protein P3X46_024300 [Hevea brasiliensis]|uniref:BHLH domain-containing protein n=2 Tax=Hevea brasiliensis TaxID=3981 RepID=A0ABQ9L3S2_HEVBR|nr:transcription factor bHLH130 isoform X2 [Hevea brasiliensis]XP_057990962.1 transcription factor bHLH130 isoform X2 [Hevea brasiliensis]XP_057990963.1 transcription factor bHLH130 isoform X2 [Hevea brasiliensis]XP_057990964.1 transcription factor bHLH130 isoform X2 [Hevea brasiliensis]XP_057990965.1 transcription factor bHLH130 isoform X2 [Hevea brasiliensis]KAJ9158743.1 hypothetical protein P3X46_024300 [Hevea brasiliensis]